MIESLYFLPHPGEEDGDSLHGDERHGLQHQDHGPVLHEGGGQHRGRAEHLANQGGGPRHVTG